MAKKDIDERVAEIDKRCQELEVERKKLLVRKSQQQRKDDTRRKIILGGIVLGDEKLKPLVLSMLDDKLTKSNDRALFWLPDRGKAASSAPVAETTQTRPATFESGNGNS